MTRVELSERGWGWKRQPAVGRGESSNLGDILCRIGRIGWINFMSSRKVELAGPLVGMTVGTEQRILTPGTGRDFWPGQRLTARS